MPASDAHHAPVSTWPLLWETLRAQRRNLLIGTLIGLAWTVGKVASPMLVRFGIDRGIRDGEMLWLWAGLIAIAGLFAGFFTAFRRFYAFREARWTETRLRERLFGHIMSLHIGYHDRAQTGQLMSRSSSDLNQIQMFVVMIPITLSNLAMITRGHGHPVRHRLAAGVAGARLVAAHPGRRESFLARHPSRGARRPGRAGRARDRRRGDRRWRPRRQGLRRRAGAGREAAHRGRRHPAGVDQGRSDPSEVSCRRWSCFRRSG